MTTKPEVTEFAVAGEVCCALITPFNPTTGDRLSGAISVGYYPVGDGSTEDLELWIEQEGHRIQFPAIAIQQLAAQLRRAAQIAKNIGAAA